MGNNTLLFSNGIHQNILLEDFGRGQMVQANVHLIVDNKKSIILDPGGHKVFKHVLTEIGAISGIGTYYPLIFYIHQEIFKYTIQYQKFYIAATLVHLWVRIIYMWIILKIILNI